MVHLIFLSALYWKVHWASARYGLPRISGLERDFNTNRFVGIVMFPMAIGARQTMPAKVSKEPFAACILEDAISAGIEVMTSPAA